MLETKRIFSNNSLIKKHEITCFHYTQTHISANIPKIIGYILNPTTNKRIMVETHISDTAHW